LAERAAALLETIVRARTVEGVMVLVVADQAVSYPVWVGWVAADPEAAKVEAAVVVVTEALAEVAAVAPAVAATRADATA
jgi:uncharacterized membrane protein